MCPGLGIALRTMGRFFWQDTTKIDFSELFGYYFRKKGKFAQICPVGGFREISSASWPDTIYSPCVFSDVARWYERNAKC